jgi:hypothetical protein
MRKISIILLLVTFVFSANQEALFAMQQSFASNQYLAITSQMTGNLDVVFRNVNAMSRRYNVKTIRMLDDMTIEYRISANRRVIEKYKRTADGYELERTMLDLEVRNVEDLLFKIEWILRRGHEILLTNADM